LIKHFPEGRLQLGIKGQVKLVKRKTKVSKVGSYNTEKHSKKDA
jgi:hypothetical protein